jgi:hypothetical protein
MKLSNKTKLYIYVVFLFIFTFLLATRLIHAFKTNDFDYMQLGINGIILAMSIIQILRYAKKENEVNSK